MFGSGVGASQTLTALSTGETYQAILAAPQRNTEVDALALAYGVDVDATLTIQRTENEEEGKVSLGLANSWSEGNEVLQDPDGIVYEIHGVKHDTETVTLGVSKHPDQ